MLMLALGLAFLIAIASGTYLLLDHSKTSERRNRALELIGGVAETKADKAAQKTAGARDDIAKKLRATRVDAEKAHKKNSITAMILQSGKRITLMSFWIWSVVSGVALFGLGMLIKGPLLALFMGAIGLFGLPRFVLSTMGKKRQKAFLDEFADALDAMARLLKAGMPVGEAIAMCAREYAGPVGEEMRRIYDAQKLGVPLSTAVLECTKRIPVPEVRMLATALIIQQQTGSSLSEVLENLSSMIRARYRLKRKIVALSSEAKVSAMIIGALPIFVTLALKAVNPEYIDLLFLPGLGQVLLWGAIIWMSMGILVMRQMINFRI